MKLQRPGLVAGLVAGVLALSACGSDNTADSGAGSGSASASGASLDCASGTLSWDGSSAQKTAVTALDPAVPERSARTSSINYPGEGSGAGRTAFYGGQIPMAGSDAPIAEEDRSKADARCSGGKAITLPTVLTPVEFVYNVSGVTDLTLTPDILAKVFSGKITNWSDPEIAAANKGVTLPNKTITTVHHSTDSGTTQNFAKFLAAQVPVHLDVRDRPGLDGARRPGRGRLLRAGPVGQGHRRCHRLRRRPGRDRDPPDPGEAGRRCGTGGGEPGLGGQGRIGGQGLR